MKRLLCILCLAYVLNIESVPRVTVITIIKDNQNCMEQFLINAFNQSLFYESEIIIIDNNSTEHEDLILKPYFKAFTNLKYLRINTPSSLASLLTIGVKLAHAPLISYCAIHDRRTIFSLEESVKILENQSSVDVVCSNYCTTSTLNAPWFDDEDNFAQIKVNCDTIHRSQGSIGPLLVWRKTIHIRFGYFNEEFDQLALDEMWCRLINNHGIFYKLEMVSGLCYQTHTSASPQETAKLAQMYPFIR